MRRDYTFVLCFLCYQLVRFELLMLGGFIVEGSLWTLGLGCLIHLMVVTVFGHRGSINQIFLFYPYYDFLLCCVFSAYLCS